ncbi:kinase-like domain-containing protein [Mycena latifolia]|nr:kinase-like domain-containing protein [Mycena latifolia]
MFSQSIVKNAVDPNASVKFWTRFRNVFVVSPRCSPSAVKASPIVSPFIAPSAPRLPTMEDFIVLSQIGRGGTSSVFLVKEKETGKLYALKQAPKWEQDADIAQEQSILKEVAGLPDGPRSLLTLVGSWADSDNYYLLTPWCGGKGLSSLLVSGQKFDTSRVKAYMAQLVVAVQALHQLNIIHRDIKPANVFLTKEGNVVLGDFGFAKMFRTTLMSGSGGAPEPQEIKFDVDDSASFGSFLKPSPDDSACITQERCGTLHWMSPAQHAGTPYSFDADIWSFGLLFFRMRTGRMPFGERADNHAELHAAYASDPVQLMADDNLDDVTKDLIRGLLAKNPSARLTIGEVKAHRYFEGVDWNAVVRHECPVPWVPADPFVPKVGRKNLVSPGVPFEADEDPLPSFTFVAPKLFKPPPGPLKSFVLGLARSLAGKKSLRQASHAKQNETKKTAYEVHLPVGSASSLDKSVQESSPGASSERRQASSLLGFLCSFFKQTCSAFGKTGKQDKRSFSFGQGIGEWFLRRFRLKVKTGALRGLDLLDC